MRNYCNNAASNSVERTCTPIPRVVVAGLASCFGCQLQITNHESHLTDILGQINLQYWQLASSEPMPQDFDVAIIEGAVTTQESLETVKALRQKASAVIAIGACANTAGIPGIAAGGYDDRPAAVYGDAIPEACGSLMSPVSVPSVIDVDFNVRCCPIDFDDFAHVLEAALYGSNRAAVNRTMCGACKRNETTCFYSKGQICLGLVTRESCGARCVNLGRPCNGCAGLSPDANLESAREAVARYGCSVDEFDERLELFNETSGRLQDAVSDRS